MAVVARKLPRGLANFFSGLEATPRAKPLSLGLWNADEALPEGGFPRGAVIEIASDRGLARATSLALAACASAQTEAAHRGSNRTEGAWCAWIDPTATLYAPGVAGSGVDLTRLLIVRPPEEAIGRVAVRVAASRAFSVVVVDIASLPGSASGASRLAASGRDARAARETSGRDARAARETSGRNAASRTSWQTNVRRLALAVEATETSVVLLTDRLTARTAPLPVAMRIELERVAWGRLKLRVAKERHGRLSESVILDGSGRSKKCGSSRSFCRIWRAS